MTADRGRPGETRTGVHLDDAWYEDAVPLMRARCIPGGYCTSCPVTGTGSTNDTSRIVRDPRPPSLGASDTVQSTRSWNRLSATSPGVTRNPHDRVNNAERSGLSQRAEIK